jgi:hypothetical protein
MGRIGCLETSATDYQSTLRNIPDERKSQEIGLLKIHVNGKMILKWMGNVQWRSFAVMTHGIIMWLAPGLGFIKHTYIISHLQCCFIYGYLSELLSHFQCKSRKVDWYLKILSSFFYFIFLSNFAHEADSFAPVSWIYITNKYITNTLYGFNLALMCNFAHQPSQTARFALHKNSEIYTTKGLCEMWIFRSAATVRA